MRRVWNVITTLATVYRRVLVDALVAPRRFRAILPEFRRVSEMRVDLEGRMTAIFGQH